MPDLDELRRLAEAAMREDDRHSLVMSAYRRAANPQTVLALLDELERVRGIVLGLRRGDCWCEMGIGNPMVRSHSEACKAAREATDE